MFRTSRLFMVILVVLLVAAIPALAQGGRASITLITPNYPIAVEATFDVVIHVDTAGQPIDAAAAYLNFDPTVFRVERIMPGTTLPIFLQSGMDNELGRINFAAGQLGGPPPSGAFTLATVTLRALRVADASAIEISRDVSTVRDTDMVSRGESIMSSASGVLITVSADAPAPIENLNAPRIIQQPVYIPPTGFIGLDGMPGAAAQLDVLAEPLVAPVSIDTSLADAWTGDAGWTRTADGGALAADGSVSTASQMALALVRPVDLTTLAAPQVRVGYLLTGGAAYLEAKRTADAEWTRVLALEAGESLMLAGADLSAAAGEIMQFRVVFESAGGLGSLTLLNLSVSDAE